MRALLVCLAVATSVVGQSTYAPGATYWGANRYIEYVAGDAPLVISAPHDGLLQPSSIPNRTYGTMVRDTNASLSARELTSEFLALTGRRPHLIICHLHRTKLDANRAITEAAQGDPFAEQAWRDYHAFIDAAKACATQRYGRALYVDVHGHGHPLSLIELGYLLTSSNLNLSNATLNQATYRDRSSIRAVATRGGAQPFSDILRGSQSLGTFLEALGHPSVPTMALPSPNGNPYFSGGYNTQRHGSRNGGTVDGVQFELPWAERSSSANRNAFGRGSARAIRNFLLSHHGLDLNVPPTLQVEAVDAVAGERGEQAIVRVRRPGGGAAQSVGLRIGGSASPGVDYQALANAVQLPAGATQADVTVSPLNDAENEGFETITVALDEGTGTGKPSEATIVLLDDDGDPALAARWSLDRVLGVAGFPAAIADDSGNGQVATLLPSVANGPVAVAGRHGGGAGFDETDDRLAVADFDYTASTAQPDFSVAFWFQSPSSTQTGFQYVLSHGGSSAPQSLNVYFVEQSGDLRTNLRFLNNLTSLSDLDTGLDLQDGQWHHYALSVHAQGLAQVFVDGGLRAAVRTGGDRYDPAGSLYLGGRSDASSTRFYRGLLDDVRLYRRALGPAEAAALAATVPTWNAPFGQGCTYGSGAIATLHLEGVPAVGFAPRFEMRLAPATGVVVLALGVTNQAFGGLPLPLDLGFLGAPGCGMYVAPVGTLGNLASPQGAASWPLALPASANLLGSSVFGQGWVLAPAANLLGLAATQAVQVTIGGGLR